MTTRAALTAASVVLVLGLGCAGDETTTPTGTSSTTAATSTTTTSSATSSPASTATTAPSSTVPTSMPNTTTTTTTTAPVPACDPVDVEPVIADAVAAARLAPGSGWGPELEASPLGSTSASGAELAARLGLDCGARLVEVGPTGERFAVAARTGPRVAFVVLSPEPADPPPETDVVVTILTEDLEGEYLDEDQSHFVATTSAGPTIVIGHVDYSLGATAKSWQAAISIPPDGESTLESERHAIEVLGRAGARNIGIAQPPEFGSEEGYVQFISPSGQIDVVDVAPIGTVDPGLPRYVDGSTRVERIGEVEVRVTEAAPDAAPWARGAELGWSCGGFAWILQPPLNGTADEMLGFVAEILAADEC